MENEEAEEERFSTLEKKIRALEKSKKSVLELQKKMKRGIEMDPQQQAPATTIPRNKQCRRFREDLSGIERPVRASTAAATGTGWPSLKR